MSEKINMADRGAPALNGNYLPDGQCVFDSGYLQIIR